MRAWALFAACLSGCSLGPRGYEPLDVQGVAVTEAVAASVEWADDGMVVGPQHTAVRVGEDLELFLELAQPAALRLRPAALPGAARFEDDEAGGWLLWSPTAGEIGRHVVVFLIVDSAAPNVVLAQRTVVVDVLPANGLIEYGF